MFGLIKGCDLNRFEKKMWRAHFCGLCLGLKHEYGWPACLTVNSDSALLSVLCEAQSGKTSLPISHRCPARWFKPIDVIRPDDDSVRFSGVMAMLIAASKILDHVHDRDGGFRFFPRNIRKIAEIWMRKAVYQAKRIGFDPAPIETHIRRLPEIETDENRPFQHYSYPVETASGWAAAFTADIADKPANKPILYRFGQLYGRIIYLVDNYKDYHEDISKNKFNALFAAYGLDSVQSASKRIFDDTFKEIKYCLDRLDLVHREFISHLLIPRLECIGGHVFENPPGRYPMESPRFNRKNKESRVDCCIVPCDCCFCCDACDCHDDGFDCNCCDCDC